MEPMLFRRPPQPPKAIWQATRLRPTPQEQVQPQRLLVPMNSKNPLQLEPLLCRQHLQVSKKVLYSYNLTCDVTCCVTYNMTCVTYSMTCWVNERGAYDNKLIYFLGFQQHPLQECTQIGLIGPRVRLLVEEVHRREHEDVPSPRTPRVVWTVLLQVPRWKRENAMLCCVQVCLLTNSQRKTHKYSNKLTTERQLSYSLLLFGNSLHSILFRSQRMVGTQCGVTGPIVTSHVVEA